MTEATEKKRRPEDNLPRPRTFSQERHEELNREADAWRKAFREHSEPMERLGPDDLKILAR